MKKLLLITTIFLSTTFVSQAQSQNGVAAAGTVLRIYPNPAITNINFDFQKAYDQGYSILVYNFLGRKMYESTNVARRTTLNLAEYNRGVYIYHLRDNSGKLVESGKFQVSK